MYTAEYNSESGVYDILDPDGDVIAEVLDIFVEALLSHLNRGQQ